MCGDRLHENSNSNPKPQNEITASRSARYHKMLGLLIDLGALWLLLNIFSDEDRDDQELKLFGIVIAISTRQS